MCVFAIFTSYETPTVLSEACGPCGVEVQCRAGAVKGPCTVSERAAQHLLPRNSQAEPGSAGISKYLMRK